MVLDICYKCSMTNLNVNSPMLVQCAVCSVSTVCSTCSTVIWRALHTCAIPDDERLMKGIDGSSQYPSLGWVFVLGCVNVRV